MAPKTKITREMILETAFGIVRESGAEALNVRAVAKKLNCSTQPILYSFRTMEEIRTAVYRKADTFHSEFLLKAASDSENPLIGLGLAYIRFGHEEPNLFRFLFQSNQFSGMDLDQMISDPEITPLLRITQDSFGGSPKEASEQFKLLFIAVHGYASLLANNLLDYDENQAAELLYHFSELSDTIFYVSDDGSSDSNKSLQNERQEK